MSIFMTVTLNSSSSRQLTSVSFSSFSGVLSCLFVCLFGTYSFVSHFACLFLCIVLGGQAKSLGLEKVAIFSCGALISMSPLSPEPGTLVDGLV